MTIETLEPQEKKEEQVEEPKKPIAKKRTATEVASKVAPEIKASSLKPLDVFEKELENLNLFPGERHQKRLEHAEKYRSLYHHLQSKYGSDDFPGAHDLLEKGERYALRADRLYKEEMEAGNKKEEESWQEVLKEVDTVGEKVQPKIQPEIIQEKSEPAVSAPLEKPESRRLKGLVITPEETVAQEGTPRGLLSIANEYSTGTAEKQPRIPPFRHPPAVERPQPIVIKKKPWWKFW